MEEQKGQTSPQTPSSLEQIAGYLSVREAAKNLGISERSVYGYLQNKKLPGGRIGKFIVVQAEGVSHFERKAPGRVRLRTPRWRKPPLKNLAYCTTMTVRVRPGQGELLTSKLAEIHQAGSHSFPGTAARYIVQNQQDANEFDMVLVWRNAVMPPEEVREAAFAALCIELAEVFDWETATRKEGRVLLHA